MIKYCAGANYYFSLLADAYQQFRAWFLACRATELAAGHGADIVAVAEVLVEHYRLNRDESFNVLAGVDLGRHHVAACA